MSRCGLSGPDQHNISFSLDGSHQARLVHIVHICCIKDNILMSVNSESRGSSLNVTYKLIHLVVVIDQCCVYYKIGPMKYCDEL